MNFQCRKELRQLGRPYLVKLIFVSILLISTQIESPIHRNWNSTLTQIEFQCVRVSKLPLLLAKKANAGSTQRVLH